MERWKDLEHFCLEEWLSISSPEVSVYAVHVFYAVHAYIVLNVYNLYMDNKQIFGYLEELLRFRQHEFRQMTAARCS